MITKEVGAVRLGGKSDSEVFSRFRQYHGFEGLT